MVWDAFVSYSHAADGSLASAVQQGLQRFMRPWYRRRALRVFRDDTGLTVDPALWDSIVRALDQSRFFILFASPESARSRWVNREIEHWRTTKPNKHILPVVTDGGWFWDENETDFDWNRSTAVPPALKGALDQEPRHLDLAWARSGEHIDTRNPKFLDAIAELAAPMHGKSKEEMVGEDIRLRRRARRLAWSAIGGLVLLTIASILAAGVAYRFFTKAEKRRVEAVARRLAVQSTQYTQDPVLGFRKAYSVAHHPDGNRLVIGFEHGAVGMWSLAEGKALWMANEAHAGPVLSVDVSPDGAEVVSGGSGGWVRTWLVEDGTPGLNRLTHPGPTWEARYSRGHPLGDYIGSVGTDGDIEWVEANSQIPYSPTRAHRGRINALFFADDGTYATGGNDGAVAYFDPRQPRIIGGRFVDLQAPPWVVALDPSGSRVAVAHGAKSEFAFFDLETLEPLGAGPAIGAPVASGVPHPHDGPMAFGTANGAIALWTFGSDVMGMTEAHQGAVADLAYAPDGRALYSIGEDQRLKQWQVAGDAVRDPRVVSLAADRTVAVDPTGRLVAFGVPGGGVNIVDVISGKTDAELRFENGPAATAIVFSPDTPQLFVGDAYGAITLWNIRTWQLESSSEPGHRGEISVLILDPDGNRLFSVGRDGNARIWNPDTRDPVGVPLTGHGSVVGTLAYDQSTRIMVTAGQDGRLIARRLEPGLWVEEGCSLYGVVGQPFSETEVQRFQLEPNTPGSCAKRAASERS